MKKHIKWLLPSMVLLTHIGEAQTNSKNKVTDPQQEMKKEEATYQDIYDRMVKENKEFDISSTKKNRNAKKALTEGEEEGENMSYMNFVRWDNYWRWRVNTNDPNKTGRFSSANNSYKVQSNSICRSNLIQANWTLLGPTSQAGQCMGQVNCIERDPGNSNILYAATNQSGLWKTTNGGANWINITDGIYDPLLGVKCFKINPNNSNVIIMGANGKSNIGVFRSADGGLTWTLSNINYKGNPGGVTAVNKIKFDPNNSNIVYVAAQREVFRSTDGGITFSSIYVVPTPPSGCWEPSTYEIDDLEILPGNTNVVFISTVTGVDCDNAHLIKLSFSGTNWTSTEITPAKTIARNFVRIGLAVTPAQPNSVFVITGIRGDPKIYNDPIIQGLVEFDNNTGGYKTSKIPNSTSLSYWWKEFEISPTDKNVMYFGGTVLSKSTDGGTTWNTITTYNMNAGITHADIRAINVISGSTAGTLGANDYLLVGTDGGVLKSLNGGGTWFNINGNDLAITQFFGISNSELAPDRVFGGAQDNGIFKYNAGSWNNTGVFADGYECVNDLTDDKYIYACINDGSIGIQRSSDGGTNWNYMSQPPENGLNPRPFLMNETDKKLYVGYHNVWECANPKATSTTWTKLSNFSNPSDVVIGALAVAPSDPNVIYAAMATNLWGGTKANVFYKTTDHGLTWSDISANVPALEWFKIKCITVDPHNPNRLWIGYDGYSNTVGTYRVLYSSDGGQTWADISGGLPVFTVNDIVYEKGTDDGLYCATDVGVYYKNGKMSEWSCYMDNGANKKGLPRCIVTDLEINYAKNVLRAATYGRGVWQSTLACAQDYDYTLAVNQTTNQYYEVQNNIYSTQVITSTANDVTYRAGSKIELNPGFTSYAGNKFKAFIHPCNMIGNSPDLKQMDQTDFSLINQLENQTSSINTGKSSLSGGIEILPNPNNGKFDILLPPDEIFDVVIMDLKGNVVYKEKSVMNNVLKVNISELATGIYLIRAGNQNKSLVQKVIID